MLPISKYFTLSFHLDHFISHTHLVFGLGFFGVCFGVFDSYKTCICLKAKKFEKEVARKKTTVDKLDETGLTFLQGL